MKRNQADPYYYLFDKLTEARAEANYSGLDLVCFRIDQAFKELRQASLNKHSGHDLYRTGDVDVTDAICDRNGEVVLKVCRACGGGEAALPTHCPGARMTPETMDKIIQDLIDFIDGQWIEKR